MPSADWFARAIASMEAVDRTLDDLIAKGEARRLRRSETEVTVREAHLDDTESTIYGKVEGTTNLWNARIRLAPRRGFHCDCPDSLERGREVGPCKHVLALAKHWKAEYVGPSIRQIKEAAALEDDRPLFD